MSTRILGIESSCDETAAAVVSDGLEVLSNVVASQIEIHKKYGGVVPELASREHLRQIVPVVREAAGTSEDAAWGGGCHRGHARAGIGGSFVGGHHVWKNVSGGAQKTIDSGQSP